MGGCGTLVKGKLTRRWRRGEVACVCVWGGIRWEEGTSGAEHGSELLEDS